MTLLPVQILGDAMKTNCLKYSGLMVWTSMDRVAGKRLLEGWVFPGACCVLECKLKNLVGRVGVEPTAR